MSKRFSPVLVTTLGAALVLTACNQAASSTDTGAAVQTAAWLGLIEEHDEGQLEWMVAADGTFRARVKDANGQEIPPSEVKGTVTVKGDAEAKLEPKDDASAAKVAPPEEELTDLRYELSVRGKTWTGLVHVPKGGTAELVSQASASVKPGARGPHGGMVDVVGDQRIELLVDEATDEVRVYLLDQDLKPKAVGDAEMTLGLVESHSSHLRLQLKPEGEGRYLIGRASQRIASAQRITVVLKDGGKQKARVVGMGAARVVHSAKGKPLELRVTLPEQANAEDKTKTAADVEDKTALDGDVDAKQKVEGKSKIDLPGKVDAPGKVHAPKVEVPGKSVTGKAKGKAGVSLP